LGELLDVSRHMERLNIDDFREVLGLTPARELQNRMELRPAGIGITDIGGEVLDEPLGRLRRRRV
jgi:hypothetical protein